MDRELDERIARALGHETIVSAFHKETTAFLRDGGAPVPRYSSSWEAMGELIEDMGRRGYAASIGLSQKNGVKFNVTIIWQSRRTKAHRAKRYHWTSASMPEAVARAALSALDARGEK